MKVHIFHALIRKEGIATYNPSNPLDVTNEWAWSELNGLTLDAKSRSPTEFILHIRKKGKVEQMRFSTEHRDELMTEAMQFYKYCLAIHFKIFIGLFY